MTGSQVEQVRALLADFDAWTPYQTRDIGGAFSEESVRDLVADLRDLVADFRSTALDPDEPRFYVACGCDGHGDHLGCVKSCEQVGCAQPLGVESQCPDVEHPRHNWAEGSRSWAEGSPECGRCGATAEEVKSARKQAGR